MFDSIAIIICTPDPAAMTVKKSLLGMDAWTEEGEFEGHLVYSLGSRVKMYTTDTVCIDCEYIDSKIEADFFIFATKHVSKAGVASLTVHTQGNFGVAKYGGKDKDLAIGSGTMLGNGFLKLLEIRDREKLKIEVIQEATHHGPALGKPSMFIEIGCCEKEWNDAALGKVNAEVILHLVSGDLQEFPNAIGIGGLHHCPRFTKVFLSEKIAFVHVCAKYLLKDLNKDMILQAIERCVEPVKYIYLDWKGLSGEKERLKLICEEICAEKNLELRRC